MNLSARSQVKAYLTERGLALKKRWGQNFLVDRGYRHRIVDASGLRSDDRVWEIGPGLGSLTELIVSAAHNLVLFEVDWGLVSHLRDRFESETVKIVPGDFRKTWRREYDDAGPTLIIGNLPYRLGATMIGDLLEASVPCRRMVFTVQREVADRMTSAPGARDYSSFSVLTQVGASVRSLFDIPPAAFLPVPEVRSRVVELVPRDGLGPHVMKTLARLAKLSFAARRKTLRRNIAATDDPDLYESAFTRAGVDLVHRAEEVSPEEFLAVCMRLIGP